MKLIRYILMLWLASSASLVSGQYTLTDDDVYVNNGIITSCSYDFAITDIIIPDTLDGQAVRVIPSNDPPSIHPPFYDRGIASVVFPSTLISLGSEAFAENYLKNIVLPVNPEYGEYGWKNWNGERSYQGGDTIYLDPKDNCYHGSFYIPAEYTLTDDDVEIVAHILNQGKDDDL